MLRMLRMSLICTHAPDSREYARDYMAGWRAADRCTDGALERADDRGVSHAWYDGYADRAAGRERWTYRTYHLRGCVQVCGFELGWAARRCGAHLCVT
jgi:hypothetical protein